MSHIVFLICSLCSCLPYVSFCWSEGVRQDLFLSLKKSFSDKLNMSTLSLLIHPAFFIWYTWTCLKLSHLQWTKNNSTFKHFYKTCLEAKPIRDVLLKFKSLHETFTFFRSCCVDLLKDFKQISHFSASRCFCHHFKGSLCLPIDTGQDDPEGVFFCLWSVYNIL